MPSLIIVGMRRRATSVRITHCRDNRKRYTPLTLPRMNRPSVRGYRRGRTSAKGASHFVDDPHLPLRAGAVRPAEPLASDLDSLADDLDATVLADGCHTVDGAGETVEDVYRALRMHLEGHPVVVSADLATCHAPQGGPPRRHGRAAAWRVARQSPVRPAPAPYDRTSRRTPGPSCARTPGSRAAGPVTHPRPAPHPAAVVRRPPRRRPACRTGGP